MPPQWTPTRAFSSSSPRFPKRGFVELDTTLVSFGTRETLSAPSPTRGITAAGQWIFDEMTRSSPKLQVSFDTYRVAPQGRVSRPVDVRNIVAILPGRTERRVYVSGHYDSVNIGTQIAMNTTAGARSPQDLSGLQSRHRRARRE